MISDDSDYNGDEEFRPNSKSPHSRSSLSSTQGLETPQTELLDHVRPRPPLGGASGRIATAVMGSNINREGFRASNYKTHRHVEPKFPLGSYGKYHTISKRY